MNYTTYTVTCAQRPWAKETFRVDFVWHENRWFPLPVNICDNSDNSYECHKCTAEIIRRALQDDFPYFR